MTEVHNKNPRHWYVKRKKTVRGPYPCKQILRYISLGRIVDTDELSVDNESWELLADLPHLKESVDCDSQTVMREDERAFGDRRDKAPDVPEEIKNRRTGDERRQDEEEENTRHREMKTKFLEQLRERHESYASRVILVVVSLAVVTAASVLLTPSSDDINLEKQCEPIAKAGVNWDNCKLDGITIEGADLQGASIKNARLRSAKLLGANFKGANLSYVDFATADLSNSQMVEANLKGANLQGADLSYVDLHRANLSYADFTNANLGGADITAAILDNAVWMNGKVCAVGSVGECL